MTRHPRTLLVIITEAVLEKRLIADLRRIGAHGWTVHDVRGGSEHAVHEDHWEAERMIEMKVICTDDVADRLAARLLASYGDDYGLTLFFADVAVLRPQKF